eukprot:514477_1
MRKADIQVDLTIFTNTNDNDFDKCESTNCSSLQRILTAASYYSKLNIIDNDTHYALFDDFIHNIYFDLINDYIHFNNQHSHAIETINNALPECNINDCKFTQRHHETVKKDEPLSDSNLNFYRQTMDAVHFYLHHCFDVGIRVKTDEKEVKNETEEEKNDKYFDKVFSRMNKMILQRKHLTKSFERFSTKKNNKFTI